MFCVVLSIATNFYLVYGGIYRTVSGESTLTNRTSESKPFSKYLNNLIIIQDHNEVIFFQKIEMSASRVIASVKVNYPTIM